VIRLLLQIAFSLFLVISPFAKGAIELTLRMSSTQSEETHEKAETKIESSVTKKVAPPPGPVRQITVAPRPVELPTLLAAPSAAPSLHPAKYSERRLI
jgi:hypothetical protein